MKIRLLALLAGLLLALSAAADPAPEEDLYLTAMQSIADGRQADASQILAHMIAQGPRHAGEWLDLALIHCALGHDSEAEALFKDIEARFAPPQGIRDIITQQRSQGCYHWKPMSQWGASLARGTDSNANQGAATPYYTDANGVPLELLPEYKPHGDHYTVLTGDYLRDLTPDGDLGFVQLHLRQYDHLSQYNSASAFAGAEHPWQLGRWKLRTSGLLGALTLGGQLYQEQAQAQLRVTPPLPLPKRYDFSVLGSVSYTSYQTLSNFDAVTTELRTILGYRTDEAQAQVSLGYQDDRGSHLRPGGNRDGWSARLFGHRPLGSRFQGELDYSFQRWNGHAAYSPGIIDLQRNQNNHVLRGTLIYPLQRNQSIQLEYRQVRNHENITIFQYDSHQIQLSWHWTGL